MWQYSPGQVLLNDWGNSANIIMSIMADNMCSKSSPPFNFYCSHVANMLCKNTIWMLAAHDFVQNNLHLFLNFFVRMLPLSYLYRHVICSSLKILSKNISTNHILYSHLPHIYKENLLSLMFEEQ